jgi:hypothetical protein
MTPEEHLNFLQSFLVQLYRIIEDTVHETHERFEAEKAPVELWYFCDSIRFYTKVRLNRIKDKTYTIKLKDLNNNGLEIRLEKDGRTYCIKVYKSVHGLLPAPGVSFSKQMFWEQALLFGEDEVDALNLAVTWHVDGRFNLLGLDLCRPALIAGEQQIGRQEWSLPIPHPATIITATDVQSSADLDSYDQRNEAADDQDDLDISAGEGGK